MTFSEDARLQIPSWDFWHYFFNCVIPEMSFTIDRLALVGGVLPVDITQLVDSMNSLYQLSQVELSHGLIKLILVSV